MEIYNDTIIDLLSNETNLQIKESKNGIVIDNLSLHEFSEFDEA